MSEMKDDAPAVSLHPPSLYFAGLLIGYIMRVFLGGMMPLPRIAAEGLGGLMVAVGLGLALAAIMRFGEAGETLRPSTPSYQLFTEGPYRFSRNPIYLAFALMGVGFGAATLNLWIILAMLLVSALMHFFVIPEEEAYLMRRFGAEYDLYKERVRRWL